MVALDMLDPQGSLELLESQVHQALWATKVKLVPVVCKVCQVAEVILVRAATLVLQGPMVFLGRQEIQANLVMMDPVGLLATKAQVVKMEPPANQARQDHQAEMGHQARMDWWDHQDMQVLQGFQERMVLSESAVQTWKVQLENQDPLDLWAYQALSQIWVIFQTRQRTSQSTSQRSPPL
jgi:hypothetical protein